jgi:hypothetical protein
VDLDRPVRYRGLDLNTVETLLGDGKRRGCVLEEADFGTVMGVGYTEKRSQGDGNDASDVFLSARQVHLRGFIYGETRADTFDRLQDLRSALTPTTAYAEDPSTKGYLPLEFDAPTQDFGDFPDGWKLLMMKARPRSQPTFSIRRDAGAGAQHLKGGAVGWSAQLECADPRIYLREPVWEYFTGDETGTFVNRGDYPAPIDILLDVTTSSGGTLRLTVATSDVTITVPASGVRQIFRYSATLKVLTLETNTIEVLRMDLLTLGINSTHAVALPGTNEYTLDKTGTYTINGATSRMMYNEAFA